MSRIFLTFILFFYSIILAAQFPPAANQEGTSAIHKDSPLFLNWAKEALIERGEQNIADDSLNFAESGGPLQAVGPSDVQAVSLGDGGIAVLTFERPITNGVGADFAVFENGFSTMGSYFLELAFVEVSSDGNTFVRFPPTSLTDTSVQVTTFETIDPTKINNLAGKYIANYGTPFDLVELAENPAIDISNITHVRIVDVVGSLADSLATFDAQENKINDPFPTPFPTGGFDLDAVGVIHEKISTNTEGLLASAPILVYPNPINLNDNLQVEIPSFLAKNSILQIVAPNGNLVMQKTISKEALKIPLTHLSKGVYWLKISNYEYSTVKKIVVFE